MPSALRSLAVCLPLILPPAMSAFSATLPAKGYALQVWQTDDGLPQDLVTCAVQTRDGYLWFGTYGGLARFDGERFQVFDSGNTREISDDRIVSLFEDAGGTLWIGQEAGAIAEYRHGRFESYKAPGPPPHVAPIAIGSDEQGHLWAMRKWGEIDSLDSDRRIDSPIAGTRPGILAWTRGRQGSIWVLENGHAARLIDGRLRENPFGPDEQTGWVGAIAAAAGGGVWVIHGDDRIQKWEKGRWSEDLGRQRWVETPFSCGLELRDGTLALGSVDTGLYLVPGQGRPAVHIDFGNGLPQNWIRFLYEDREGTLWAGTGSAGLVSIRSSAFSVLNPPDRWQGRAVLAAAPDRSGALWIGTDGAGLYRERAGQWTHYGPDQGLYNPYVWAVAQDAGGDVWAGNYWWGGPFRLEHGRFVRPPFIDPASSPVLALAAGERPGEILVGTRAGLLQVADRRSVWLYRNPAADVCAVARDRTGTIWFGMAQGGLGRIFQGRLTLFRREDGLASNAVQCLLPTDDGTLWIGTADRGLSRFQRGKFATVTSAQGLADNAICHICDDGLGYYWLSTRHGLQRIAKSSLNRCADGRLAGVSGRIYDREDGLPASEFTGGLQGAGCRSPDGRLWFASSKGLVTVDPARIRPNPIPPPVVIETMLVDGHVQRFTGAGLPQRLAPGHRQLEFRYSGLSYVAPHKVLFRYRLDGLDHGWVDAGTRRTAFYSHLSAGHYRFRVIACNDDGLSNPAGASLAFSVAPYFWQTWWFVGLCSALALAAVAWAVRQMTRRRMRRRVEELERQHAIERERARIAQDIHDDLGVSLTRITMFSQPDRQDLADPQRAGAVLSRICATSREATRSLDEIVWAVDPRHDTLDSLASYMGRFAQELLDAANLRCRLDLPVELPSRPLTAETRHNLFLAFEEALNNAVRHAEAREVRISLEVRPPGFVLVIQDDGKGFLRGEAPAAEAGRIASGHGIESLQRRLSRIGGRCEILSEPGKGTRVSLIVGIAEMSGPS